MVKKETPQTPGEREDLSAQINTLFQTRKEAIGAYKSAVQNLINSVNTLFKIDDNILNLVIKPKKE